MTGSEHLAAGERHLKTAGKLAEVSSEHSMAYSALAQAHFAAARTAEALKAPDSPAEPAGPTFSWRDNAGLY